MEHRECLRPLRRSHGTGQYLGALCYSCIAAQTPKKRGRLRLPLSAALHRDGLFCRPMPMTKAAPRPRQGPSAAGSSASRARSACR